MSEHPLARTPAAEGAKIGARPWLVIIDRTIAEWLFGIEVGPVEGCDVTISRVCGEGSAWTGRVSGARRDLGHSVVTVAQDQQRKYWGTAKTWR